MKKNLLTPAFAVLLAAFAGAGPAAVSQVPASSSIAAHVDFEQAKSLPACSTIVNWVFGNVGFVKKEGLVLRKSFGVNVPGDLSDLLLFADGFSIDRLGDTDVMSAASYVSGKIDTARLAGAIKKAKGCKVTASGAHEIYQADFSGGVNMSFPSDGVALLAASPESATAALSVYDKKAPSISPTSEIAKEFALGAPVSVVVKARPGEKNLSVLSGEFIRTDAELIVARVTEATPGTATLLVEMTFDKPETAAQIAATINGLKLISAFKHDPATPDGIIQSFLAANVAVDGKKVSVSLSLSEKDLALLKK